MNQSNSISVCQGCGAVCLVNDVPEAMLMQQRCPGCQGHLDIFVRDDDLNEVRKAVAALEAALAKL